MRALLRSLLVLSALAGAASAQSSDADVPAPRREPLASGPAVQPWFPSGSGFIADPNVPGGPGAMTRARLEGESEASLAFAEVPGGIVLGLPARPTGTLAERLAGSALELSPEGLRLRVADGASLALPPASPALLLAALRFAQDGAGHWVVDVDGGGNVLLARELVDTAAGVAAVRADLSPLFFLPTDVGVKSNLVDRDVRLAADGDQLSFATDLELRFYRPARREGGAATLEDADAERVKTIVFRDAGGRLVPPEGASPAEGLLAAHLGELAELAGWVGFFRWTAAARVAGLDAVRAELERAPRPRVSTPRIVLERDRAAWVRGGASAPSAEIPEWMRRHAERVRGEH